MRVAVRRWVQIFLAVALVAATARLVWIVYQRTRPFPQRRAARARPVNPDYYVYPPRVYLSDLRSARQLKGSALWVRDGHRYPHFPYDGAARRSRQIQDPPLLPPLQRVTIEDVVSEPTARLDTREVNIVFELLAAPAEAKAGPGSGEGPGGTTGDSLRRGRPQALRSVTVGHCDRRDESCRFYLNDMFFLKHPRELYSHWGAEVWKAIEQHEARLGMTETQISFALGYGRLLMEEIGGERVIKHHPPGRPPLVITFGPDGYATNITTATAGERQ